MKAYAASREKQVLTQHSHYIWDCPLGIVGSFRASGVNKRAGVHMQRWGKRKGPSKPGGCQQGVA